MALRLKMATHKKLIDLVQTIQERHRQNVEFRDKLANMDEEYAIQKISINETEECNSAVIEGIKVPLVGAESDAITAQLASIFVTQQPVFPVLATQDNWDEAMGLQALIDTNARLQGWGRQLLLFIARSTRYNTAALAAEPAIVRSPVIKESDKPSVQDLNVTYEHHTYVKLKALDMYNTIYDPRVPPADIQSRGEYAGYNELITRSELKALGTALSSRELSYNLNKAYSSVANDLESSYFYPPDVSDFISSRSNSDQTHNWINWLNIVSGDEVDRKTLLEEDMFLKTTLYVRLIPDEFGLSSYKTPIIYRIVIINNEWVISLQEIVTPFDTLPILFSDIREDGLFWQTKSPGEQLLPYQDAATDLLNTRLNGSRRALSDRAIYDSNYLDHNQVNSTVPSAKIPLKQDLRNLGDRPDIRQVYYPIPFEGQGVINTLTDLNTIMTIKDQVNGQNFISRGERQQGNRSATEFQAIASKTEDKIIPYAIRLEEQVFNPLKLIIKNFIILFQATNPTSTNTVIDPYSEQERTIDIAAINSKLVDFKLTDGLHTKQSVTNPEVLITIMQTMAQDPEFNQSYDRSKILAEILNLFNIDASKFRRQQIGQQAPTTQQPIPGPGVPAPAQPEGSQQAPPEAGGNSPA